MCRHAQTDGIQHPMTLRFAGARPGRHAHQDMMEILQKQSSALHMIQQVPGLARDASTAMMSSDRRLGG